MSIRIVFMGSPEFALPSLRALEENFQVVGVVTQPDRPAGRGKTMTSPPVKLLAETLSLPTIQPERLRDPEAIAQIQIWKPDLIVVAAFGQILRQVILNLPRLGCLNVHASILPRWRGAAPIPAAILAGDTITGVTIMRMDPGIDTGPFISQRTEPILPKDTTSSLTKRLAQIGAELLISTIPAYIQGNLEPHSQDNTQATYAPMIKKEDGLLDFHQPAIELERRVRAYHPWPGAYMFWQGQNLKILSANVIEERASQPGQTLAWGSSPAIGTGQGLLVLEEVQPAGKKAISGKAFLAGARGWI